MELSPELQVILQVLQSKPKLVLPTSVDWNLVYKLAIRHRVWHQLLAVLTPLHQEQPIPIYAQLAKRCRQDKLKLLATAAETMRLAHAFSAKHISHCFIKGMVLNATIYDAFDTRPCKDIDVWVEPNNYDEVRAILVSLGYKKTSPSYEPRGFQQEYYINHRHDMEFFHAERKIFVEVHFRLNYFGINFLTMTPAIFNPLPFFNNTIITLQDNYHLLYLMIHGAIHAWSRLRWLNDIALYIKSGKCDLNQIMALAKQIDCEHIVEQTLILVQNSFGKDEPCLANLIPAPSNRAIKLARIAQAFIAADYELTEDYPIMHKMFFKYRFYIQRLAISGQKLQAVVGDLFKIDNLFPYVNFPKKLSFMYYMLYPLWVIKIIISR